MRVFEFHFNPKLKPDLLFDSFYYEPENIYERRVGSLYLVGALKNALPQNARFLDHLAKVIKEKYYRLTLKNPEKALRESLKEANEFLEQVVKRGDVRWLGNLSFAALSLKNNELNFTKVGDLKIFLLRNGRVIDIDRKLKFDEIAPWPLRIFGNIVSGKLAENDVLLVSTKEVTEFFEKENLLPEIAKIESFDEKELKGVFNTKREEVLKISGVCLAIILTKETLTGRKEVISPKSYPKEFNLKQVFTEAYKSLCAWFSPIFNFYKKIKLPSLPQIKLSQIKPVIKLKWSKIELPKLPKFPKLNKNLIPIIALVFFLFLGFLYAQIQEKQQVRLHQTTLDKIQEKVTQAESFLILKKVKPQAVKDANSLLKESWEEISPLVKVASTLPKSFANQIYTLRDKISENLYQLNQLIEIPEPELVFEFSPKEFVPQKMVIFNKEVYFFSPYSQNLFELNENGEGKLIQEDKKFNLAANLEDSVLFFLKPNQLTILKNEELNSVLLQESYPDFNFNDFSSFKGNLYFLDKNSCQIIKYPYLGQFSWGAPEIWMQNEARNLTCSGAKLMAIDGFIWILNKDNSISKYYAGRLQETIKLDIFPEPKDFSKIFTSATLPYLYLLEPIQKRILIFTKSGQIVKQFQSEKFDNLMDFSVSNDGKIIWLLNGLRVYKISE